MKDEATARDLARSGLTVADIKAKPTTLKALKLGFGFDAACYVIPYLEPRSRKPTGFYRVRLHDGPKDSKGKPLRYLQPRNASPRLYFAPGVRWGVVLDSAASELWITEGEKKAACACKVGIPTIGIGGVWNWQVKGKPIADLDGVVWRGRKVRVVFDSDVAHNQQVRSAMRALVRELEDRGASVGVTFLPEDEKGKVGLDDYIVRHGVEATKALGEEVSEQNEVLWKVNDQWAFIREQCSILELGTGRLYNPQPWATALMSNRKFVYVDGEGKVKRIGLGKAWMEWPQRREYDSMTYAPGMPQVVGAQWNRWRGWGAEPVKGDVSMFLKLVEHLFKGDRAAIEYFIRWCAYPIQHPGIKMYSSTVLWSRGQGTGKTFLGYLVGSMYGANMRVVKQEMLMSSFNEWQADVQFVVGEELTGSDRRRDADRMKPLITQNEVTINAKYQQPYTIPDCANYFFTSQHPDALFLEDGDRRYFVVNSNDDPLPKEFYVGMDAWYRSGDAAKALLHYFMHEVDTGDFNPRGPAPMTAAKMEMIVTSRSDLDAWCYELLSNPTLMLAAAGARAQSCDLWTARELQAFYEMDGSRRATAHALCKSLRKAGGLMLPATSTAMGTRILYAIRNITKWRAASHKARAEHYDKAVSRG